MGAHRRLWCEGYKGKCKRGHVISCPSKYGETNQTVRWVKNKNRAFGGFWVCLLCWHGRMRKWNTGVCIEEFEAKFEEQGRRCAICKRTDGGGRGWHADHNHVTKKFRGVLCGACNWILGYAKENTETLRAAIGYLDSHR